jgi:hypothetical protein
MGVPKFGPSLADPAKLPKPQGCAVPQIPAWAPMHDPLQLAPALPAFPAPLLRTTEEDARWALAAAAIN